jgi:phosphoribosyl-ATP pyrophosphohydrolase/phosphoribosyl-AMP cyclohydrolase
MTLDPNSLDFAKGNGLVTVIAQEAESGAVLMVAHADAEAIEKTITTGEMHYHSRTRGLWRKGETSGNTQRVVSLTRDCDGDAVLARVVPAGPACHTGEMSCFGDEGLTADTFATLDAVIAERASSVNSPAPSYTQRLLADRNLRLKKIGEEAAELVTACADGDRERAIEEAADLFYHALVGLRSVGADLSSLRASLARRAK